MAKPKSPLLSLATRGTLGGKVTFQEWKGTDIAREKPIPSYRRTLSQAYQRWDYQHYLNEWCHLNQDQKQLWKSQAAHFHTTGLAYFLKDRLLALPDIKLRYHLDAILSGIVYDSSKQARHGTVTGASLVKGFISNALRFDGIDDWVNIPIAAFPADDGTIMWWMKGNFTAVPVHKMRAFSTRHTGGFNYEWRTYHKAPFRCFFPVGTDAWSVNWLTLGDIDWTHFAITWAWDGSKTTYLTYQVGEPIDSLTKPFKAIPPNSQFTLGRWYTDYFPVQIDEFITLNRALPPDLLKQYAERRYP